MADRCLGPVPAPLLRPLLSIRTCLSLSHRILSTLGPLFHLQSCSLNPSPVSPTAPHLQVPPELPSRPLVSHRPFINRAGLTAGLWAALSSLAFCTWKSLVPTLAQALGDPGEGLTIPSGQEQGSRMGSQVWPCAVLVS